MIDELFVALCELGGKAGTRQLREKANEMYPRTWEHTEGVGPFLKRLQKQGWVIKTRRGEWVVADISLRSIAEQRIGRELGTAGLEAVSE